VGGYDEDQGPQIFQIEASGAYYCWKATALGKGSKEAKQFLEKTYTDDMDIGDATHTAIKALKNSFEGALTEKNLEVAIIKTSDPDKRFHVLTQSEIVSQLANATELTKVQVRGFLEAQSKLAYKNAKNGFTLPGLGKLVLVNRKARMGRNPATGEAIKIPAKRVVKFRVAKAAKDAIVGKKK